MKSCEMSKEMKCAKDLLTILQAWHNADKHSCWLHCMMNPNGDCFGEICPMFQSFQVRVNPSLACFGLFAVDSSDSPLV